MKKLNVLLIVAMAVFCISATNGTITQIYLGISSWEAAEETGKNAPELLYGTYVKTGYEVIPYQEVVLGSISITQYAVNVFYETPKEKEMSAQTLIFIGVLFLLIILFFSIGGKKLVPV